MTTLTTDHTASAYSIGCLSLMSRTSRLQECVRVAHRLDQIVGVVGLEVLGGAVRALHQLRARDESMPEELLDYLSRTMAPRIEEDDRSVRRLPVQTRRVDAGPHVSGTTLRATSSERRREVGATGDDA